MPYICLGVKSRDELKDLRVVEEGEAAGISNRLLEGEVVGVALGLTHVQFVEELVHVHDASFVKGIRKTRPST